MIRVGDLTLFERLEADKLAPFKADRPRDIKITFNAPQRVAIYVLPMDDLGGFPEEPFFLATVHGLEDVSFFASGAFALTADGDVYFKTVDGAEVATVIPDAETFTRIAERRVRNPELEHMQYLLERNMQRRMAPVLEELADLRRQPATRREDASEDNRSPATSTDRSKEQPSGPVLDPPIVGDLQGGRKGAAGSGGEGAVNGS